MTDPQTPDATGGQTVLFTSVKNEAVFLLEWIAYHKVIGFERIVIVSNPSDDGTTELLSCLAELGEIEHIALEVPDGESPQGFAAAHANKKRLFSRGDWFIWLDADEFLVVNQGARRLPDLLAAIEGKTGILIPWRLMGDGGNARFPGRFVSEDFVRGARRYFHRNYHIKMLFQFAPGIAGLCKRGLHRARLARDHGFSADDFIMANGKPIDAETERNQRWLKGRDHPGSARITRREHGYHLAQINHYFVRTPEHYALKKLRGRGYRANEAGEANRRHTLEYYKAMNFHGDEDRKILHFQDATTDEIARLMAQQGVAEAQAEAEQRTAAKIAALSEDQIPPAGKRPKPKTLASA